MIFDDWRMHKKEQVAKELLWEYDVSSPEWDWQRMAPVVVARVLERGGESDYYAVFQLYGGRENVREIVKKIPSLSPVDARWACVLFGLEEEDLACCTRKRSRRELLNSLPD